MMWRVLIAGVLVLHGLGHVMGFLAAWTSIPMGFVEGKSWLFSDGVLIDSVTGKIFGLFWLAALVGFVGAGIGILVEEDGWRVFALAAAVISLLVILPWWNAVTPGSRVAAVLVDAVTLIAVLGWGNRIAESLK